MGICFDKRLGLEDNSTGSEEEIVSYNEIKSKIENMRVLLTKLTPNIKKRTNINHPVEQIDSKRLRNYYEGKKDEVELINDSISVIFEQDSQLYIETSPKSDWKQQIRERAKEKEFEIENEINQVERSTNPNSNALKSSAPSKTPEIKRRVSGIRPLNDKSFDINLDEKNVRYKSLAEFSSNIEIEKTRRVNGHNSVKLTNRLSALLLSPSGDFMLS